jgi:hypothetical protein
MPDSLDILRRQIFSHFTFRVITAAAYDFFLRASPASPADKILHCLIFGRFMTSQRHTADGFDRISLAIDILQSGTPRSFSLAIAISKRSPICLKRRSGLQSLPSLSLRRDVCFFTLLSTRSILRLLYRKELYERHLHHALFLSSDFPAVSTRTLLISYFYWVLDSMHLVIWLSQYRCTTTRKHNYA